MNISTQVIQPSSLANTISYSPPVTHSVRSDSSSPSSFLLPVAIFSILLLSLGSFLIWKRLQNQPTRRVPTQPQSIAHRRPLSASTLSFPSQPPPREELTQLFSNPLYANLVTMLNGDRTTADRLIGRIRATYPNRSEQWWYEKAIDDLLRDRR